MKGQEWRYIFAPNFRNYFMSENYLSEPVPACFMHSVTIIGKNTAVE